MSDLDEASSLSILQVVPCLWGSGAEPETFARRAGRYLTARGHRVAVLAPAPSRAAFRDARRQVEEAIQRPEALFEDAEGPRVLTIGGVPPPGSTGGRRTPVPSESAKLVERLLAAVPFDILHVHDPFMPSLGSTALRHSFALNVGTFHLPQERLLSTHLARPLFEIFFGRLDARTVGHQVTGELLDRYFPGPYELIAAGAGDSDEGDEGDGEAEPSSASEDAVEGAAAGLRPGSPHRPLRIYYPAVEERGALRLFLRGLRRLPTGLAWRATVALPDTYGAPPRVSASLRDQITFEPTMAGSPVDSALGLGPAGHDVICLASTGSSPAPTSLREGLWAGAVPVVADTEIYADIVEDGRLGLMFPLGDAETLAAQITRLVKAEPDDPHSLEALGGQIKTSPAARRSWAQVGDELEGLYRRLAARRHPSRGNAEIRRRLARRRLIEVDLHMHTDHSSDCATPVRVLLETARDRGLGAIAITDHNEISGALAAREVAAEMGGIQVIVGEEVKTASQGEVIGLFLEEKIPRGMTMAETIAEIRRQGGLVYVPHPFDRLHSVPDYEHLLDIVEEIDFMEVFNPRVAISSFNEEAERFARKYRIIPAAGSDSHVAQGLGSVRQRIREFDGPLEFKEAMRDAEITRRHKNLVYVQALKFLQTTGRPKAPKRELSAALPVRGGRPRRRV